MVTGLVTVGAVALTAAPANAHENYVKGTAECVDGRYVVSWEVTNKDETNDETIAVTVEPTGSEIELADKIKAGETIKGTQTLPAGSRGIKDEAGRDVAKIHVHGEWKTDKGTLKHSEYVDVPLPGDSCGSVKPSETPAVQAPSAFIVLSCEAFSIELTNPTAETVKFRVAIKLDNDKPLIEEFAVAAGKKLALPDDLDEADAGSLGEVSEGSEESEEGDLEFTKIAVSVSVKDKQLAEKSLDLATCDDGGVNPTKSPTASPSVSASVAPGTGVDVTVSPAADSEDSLPVTGASLGGLIAAAVLVLGLGIGMVVFTRRRKRA